MCRYKRRANLLFHKDERRKVMIEQVNIETIYSKREGLPVFKMAGYLLHSKYDPIKEAEVYVEKHYRKHHLHILFGYGNGYIVQQFAKRITSDEFLLVVEPNRALEKDIQSTHVNNERIKVAVIEHVDEFEAILQVFIKRFPQGVQFIISPNYDKIYSELCKQCFKKAKDVVFMEKINRNTFNFFAHDWQKNYLLNLVHAFEDEGLQVLEKQFDAPAIIVAGGPSLTKQLPLLEQVREKALIICAGSTINTLLAHHIKPHIVVTIDGGINNYLHFESIDMDDIFVIYSLLVHHQIIDEHKGKRAFFIPNNMDYDMASLTTQLLNKHVPSVLSGGSVANFALFIAHRLTSGPICLIGQDLAYTNNQTHAQHNRFYREISEEDKKQRGMFYTEGYFGDEVLTDYGFYSMKTSFEQFASFVDDSNRLFNCTEGGVRLKGYKQIPFKQFIEKYIRFDDGRTVFVDQFVQPQKRSQEEWEVFLERIEREIEKYREVADICKKAIRLLGKNRSNQYFDEHILKKLNKYDRKLDEQLKTGIMQYLLMPIVYHILCEFLPSENETKKEMFHRVYHRSKALYGGVEKAASETVFYLSELRKRIKEKIANMKGE